MIADGWTIFAAALLGALSANVAAEVARAVVARYRRRLALSIWQEGADRARAAHPLAPEDTPPAEPRAVDLDLLSPEERTKFFERIGAPRRGE